MLVDAQVPQRVLLAVDHQQRGALPAALVAAGRLAGFERAHQPLGQVQLLGRSAKESAMADTVSPRISMLPWAAKFGPLIPPYQVVQSSPEKVALCPCASTMPSCRTERPGSSARTDPSPPRRRCATLHQPQRVDGQVEARPRLRGDRANAGLAQRDQAAGSDVSGRHGHAQLAGALAPANDARTSSAAPVTRWPVRRRPALSLHCLQLGRLDAAICRSSAEVHAAASSQYSDRGERAGRRTGRSRRRRGREATGPTKTSSVPLKMLKNGHHHRDADEVGDQPAPVPRP